MDIELRKFLFELEDKYEVEMDYYFKMPEFEREELAISVADFFIQRSEQIPPLRAHYITAIHEIIQTSLNHDEFEKVDLFSRINKHLIKTIDS